MSEMATILATASTDATGVQIEFESILRVCANLTSTEPIEQSLNSLLGEARRLVRAEAGSVFVAYRDRLRFACAQNDARPDCCEVSNSLDDRPWAELRGKTVAIDRGSIAGYVAQTGESVRIDDVYALDETARVRFDASYDKRTGYRTCSVLAVPLQAPGGRVLGVLQVINRQAGAGRIESFSERDERILKSLAAVAAVSLRNAQLHEELYRSHLDTILRLATAAEFRDGETGDHIRRMSCYCEAVARRLGWGRELSRKLLVASPMHDVGKLGIPDAILSKPGPLTPEERSVMQRHTVIGAKILDGSDNELLAMAKQIAHYHHERWDGTGYPARLTGETIPLEARIAAVADVFDALTSPRVYKAAFDLERSLGMLTEGRGTHFDPEVIDAFTSIEEDIQAIYEAYQPT